MIKNLDVQFGYFNVEPLAGQRVFAITIDTDDNPSSLAEKRGEELYALIKNSVAKKELTKEWDDALLGKYRVIIKSDELMEDCNTADFDALYVELNKTSWLTQGGKLTAASKAMEFGYYGTPKVMTLTADSESWYEHFNLNIIDFTGISEGNLALIEAMNSRFAYAVAKLSSTDDVANFVKLYESMQNVQPQDRYVGVVTNPDLVDAVFATGLRCSIPLPDSDSVVKV